MAEISRLGYPGKFRLRATEVKDWEVIAKKRSNELSHKTLLEWAIKRPAHPNDSHADIDPLPANAGVHPDAESATVEPNSENYYRHRLTVTS